MGAARSLPSSRKRREHDLGAGSLTRPLPGTPVHLLPVKTVFWPRVCRGKMKLSRQLAVLGSAIFCVAIFSLFLMLDRGHLGYPMSPCREASFPQASAQNRKKK